MVTATDSSQYIHPGTKSLQPTPSDNKDVADAGLWRAIVGNGASAVNVAVNLVDDADNVIIPLVLQPNALLAISVRRVRATGTSALAGEFFLVR